MILDVDRRAEHRVKMEENKVLRYKKYYEKKYVELEN